MAKARVWSSEFKFAKSTRRNPNTDNIHARDRPAQDMPPAARRCGNDDQPVAAPSADAEPEEDATEDRIPNGYITPS